ATPPCNDRMPPSPRGCHHHRMGTDSNDRTAGPTIAETHAALTAAPSMFEIDEADVFGTRLRVWKHAPASLRVILEASRARVDAPFIVYEDETLTFEEHFRAAAHLATALIERYGIEKGDRVAIVMRNFPE